MAGEHIESVRIRLEVDDIIRTTSGRQGPNVPGQPGNRRPAPNAPDSGGTRPTTGRRGAGRARTVGAEVLGAGVAGAAADAIAGTDVSLEDFAADPDLKIRWEEYDKARKNYYAKQRTDNLRAAKTGAAGLVSSRAIWEKLTRNPIIAIGTAYAGASVLSAVADRSIEIMRGNVSPGRAFVGAINEQSLDAAEALVKFSATNPLSTLFRMSIHGFSKTSEELNTGYDAAFRRGAFALGTGLYQATRHLLNVFSGGGLPTDWFPVPGFIKEARAAAEADVTKRFAAETVQQQAASLSILYRLGIPTDITAGLLRKHADLQHRDMIGAAQSAMNRAAKGLNPE